MSNVETWAERFRTQTPRFLGAGVPWMDAMRQRAIDRFATEGWPGSRQDGWRHTSLALLQQQDFSIDKSDYDTGAIAKLVAQLRQDQPGHWLIFVDARFIADVSDIGKLPDGAHVMPVSEALKSHGDLVQELMNDDGQDTLPAALNTAMAGDGGFISLSPEVTLDQPVHLVFISANANGASFPRNLLCAERGSRATVVEHYVSAVQGGLDAEASLTNAVTRTRIATDASLTHMKLQMENEQAFHLASISTQQDEQSTFNSHSISFGARLARNDIRTAFGGKNCETLFNGLYYVDGRRHVDHNTLINHAHPDGVSREYYRGILADTSRGVFGGRILVAPGADGTDAVQRSDSLLLSRLARADARPELEIYADDVKCAHGATVGQLDDDAMFYLRSRGLDSVHAHNVLTYAFAAEAIERISVPGLRQRVIDLVRHRLPGGTALGDMQ